MAWLLVVCGCQPRAFVAHNFLTKEECLALIHLVRTSIYVSLRHSTPICALRCFVMGIYSINMKRAGEGDPKGWSTVLVTALAASWGNRSPAAIPLYRTVRAHPSSVGSSHPGRTCIINIVTSGLAQLSSLPHYHAQMYR
jgi:hypothetical protein